MRRLMPLLILPLLGGALAGQESVHYSIDPEKSKLEIAVYKEGFFKAFGHDHLISAKAVAGQVQFDAKRMERSSVAVKVQAALLRVMDPGVSEKDRQEIQTTMLGDKVLDAVKYPDIVFASTGVLATKEIVGGWELTLSGKLSLHGTERIVNLPLRLHRQGEDLRAQGNVMLLQTDYGITPIRVGGGAVKVKNQIKISFDILVTKSKE